MGLGGRESGAPSPSCMEHVYVSLFLCAYQEDTYRTRVGSIAVNLLYDWDMYISMSYLVGVWVLYDGHNGSPMDIGEGI